MKDKGYKVSASERFFKIFYYKKEYADKIFAALKESGHKLITNTLHPSEYKIRSPLHIFFIKLESGILFFFVLYDIKEKKRINNIINFLDLKKDAFSVILETLTPSERAKLLFLLE